MAERNPGGDFLYNAFWTGAAIGWREATQEYPHLNEAVDLQPEDDHHIPDEAAKVAKRIRADVNTLAVIGHDQSNTTNEAEPLYAEAGIPVVFPAATSSLIGYKPVYRATFFLSSDRKARATNFVRLPPPDVPYQSHALRVAAYAIAEKRCLDSGVKTEEEEQELLKKTDCSPNSREVDSSHKAHPRRIRIYVVRETSHNANVYSGPLADDLQKDDRFAQLIVGERRFDRDQLDVYTLVTSIRGSRADLVLFIGYPDSAKDLLQEMKERVQLNFESRNDVIDGHNKPKRADPIPMFLLSDACLDRDLAEARFPFEIYVTSSTMQPEQCGGAAKNYAKVLEDLKKLHRDVITGEIYAADAVMLLARAAEYCRNEHELGRRCVMDYLRSQRDIQSVCRPYHVDDGDSENALYLLYSLSRNAGLEYSGFIRNDYEKLFENRSLQ